MTLELKVLLCVAEFCNRYSISIAKLPNGYSSILAHFINESVCQMGGNITVHTDQKCDLQVTIQQHLMVGYEIFQMNHTDLEVAIVMAS